MTNLRHLTTHITTCWPTSCDVTSPCV